MRTFSAPFYARGDTRTPVIATMTGVVFNILLKIWLMDDFAQVGLAFATSIGGWISLILLAVLAQRRGYGCGDAALMRILPRLAIIGLALAGTLYTASIYSQALVAGFAALQDETRLAVCVAAGGAVYIALVGVLIGPRYLRGLARGRPRPPAA
jgi:putative peptidoglycan lipid II flippase